MHLLIHITQKSKGVSTFDNCVFQAPQFMPQPGFAFEPFAEMAHCLSCRRIIHALFTS